MLFHCGYYRLRRSPCDHTQKSDIPYPLDEVRAALFLYHLTVKTHPAWQDMSSKALKQAEQGVSVSELCRAHGMSSASFYKWRSKYGGMDASMISQMKAMADENHRLKRMYAEMSMQNDLLKEALGKKW